MTQGRGFIAVARRDLRRPAARSRSSAAPTCSAPRSRSSPALQARGYAINQFALDAMPYVVTIARARRPRPQAGRPRRPKASRRSSRSRRPADAARRTVAPPTAHDPSATPNHPTRRADSSGARACADHGGGRSSSLALVAAACGGDGDSDHRRRRDSGGGDAAPATAPGHGQPRRVGFIFVGPKDDFGYNQAAYEGSQAVKEAYPDLEVLTAENVPEDDNATRVMESMIDKGAKIIFATSYGHLDPAHEGRRGPPRRRRRAAGQLHRRRRSRRTSARTSAPCTSPCTSPASPPGRRPRPTSSATSTPSRSRRRSPTSTPSSSARSR